MDNPIKIAYLEEIIFQEIAHRLITRDGPPAVQIEIQGSKPNNQN